MANHWDSQALTVEDEADVNVGDIYQRELEFDFILKHLKPEMSILEVGCGNGYSTSIFREYVWHIDAFDKSAAMIERARRAFGETNNTFYVDDLLTSTRKPKMYDAVVCVRVLINLKNLAEQKAAVEALKKAVGPGGMLILVEGVRDGFSQLDAERRRVGLPLLTPASFNCYPSVTEILVPLNRWEIADHFHPGEYDWLTRVYYPLVVGANNVERNSPFAEAAMKAARGLDIPEAVKCARVHGYVFRGRS